MRQAQQSPFQISMVAITALWALLAGAFIYCKDVGLTSHDFFGHIEYVRILADQHRLPLPHQGWETYHPPLFYLVAAGLLAPDAPFHATLVRWFAVACGLVFLGSAAWLLSRWKLRPSAVFLSLLLLVTTAPFLYIFTSYNNDPLALALAALAVCFSWSYLRGNDLAAPWLVLCLAAGLYVKFSLFLCMAALGLGVLVAVCRGLLPVRRAISYAAILAIATSLLLPWLFFHNRRLSGELLPSNFEYGLSDYMSLPGTPAAFVFQTPFSDIPHWRDPYVARLTNVHSEKSFLSVYFLTAVNGEYVYPASMKWPAVFNLVLTLVFLIWSLGAAWKQPAGRLAALFVATTLIAAAGFIFFSPFFSSADFRYTAWAWLPLALLAAVGLSRNGLRSASGVLAGALLVSHVLFLSLMFLRF